MRCYAHDAHGPRPEAVYRWHCKNGNVVALCVECCKWWRWNAREDPGLEPSKIELIPT